MVLAPGYWVLGAGAGDSDGYGDGDGSRGQERAEDARARGCGDGMGCGFSRWMRCTGSNACEVEMTMSNTPSGNPSTQNSVSRVAQRRPRHQLAARGRSLLSPRSHAQPVVQIASVGFAAAPATPRHAILRRH